MEEDADTYLLPKKFKVKFSNELFKYSSLTGCNNPDKLLDEWTAEHKKRASILPRKAFLHWQIEQTEFTKQLSKIYKDSLNDDTAFARAWFYIVRLPLFAGHSQQTEPKIEKLAENSFVRACVEEILTWFWASEKLALVHYYNGKYPEDDKRRIEAIYASRSDIGKGKLKRPTTAVSLSNLARFRIRRYFEEKQGVLFNDSWLVKGTAVTTSQIRNKIFNLMGGFHREIDETLIPYLPIAGKKKRSTEITLSQIVSTVCLLQECTKSAHNSIRAYLDLLTTSKAGIKVECKAQERKLVLPLDKIKDDLKAPIVELARNERIRFSADEISNYIDECTRIVDKTLSSDEFQKNPIIVQFSALIYNEPIASNSTENYLVDRLLASRQSIMKLTKAPNVIESGIFVIDMAKVWEVLQERGHTIVQKCSRQIRECFHNSVSELQKEFARFKKILNFRSMDPTTMLKNKTEVNELSAQDIPKAVANLCDAYDRMHKLTQLVQFDPREHEYLINVANLRRALPRHIADHNLFFQRRLHIFAHYVRKRQTTLEVSAQNALNQMKVLNSFTNPDEVENYLAEMRVLKPLILTLHQELIELNEQEKVVNLPPLSLNEIQVVGSQVNNLWSLFDWTKRFYDFRANFYKRRRTEVRVQECQMFLDTFIETLVDLSVKLENQRSTKVFLSQLKTEIEKFRHNIPVLEVMSCARLGARHWEKMSEIVGFNLALYENATVAQIADLNLNLYIAKLKPIAFVADREGQISDQANFITDYWTETSFTMDITHFWGIHVPSNLETLIKSASEHVSKIKAYREPDNEKSFINQSLDTWIKNLNNLLNLLKKWNVLLKCWKRISNVMRHSYLKVPNEFEHFRTVSKYFRRLSRFVDEERFVIKLIEGKHIACWLNLADKHLKRVVEGLDTYLRNLRFASPRMCLISNSDIMKLLSMETAEDGLQIIQRECFPLLRELYLNDDGHLFGVNIDGERVKFESFVPISTLRDEEPQVFVDNIEKTIADFIIQDYVKYTEHRSTVKMSFRLTRVINDFILHQTQDSGFKHVFEEDALKIHLRGNQLEIPVTPDFIHSAIPAVNVDVHFVHNWALGKVPLLFANITETRSRVQQMCRNLLCSVRFLNCHPGIQPSVFDTIIGACEKGTVLFVLENVDQLTESLYNHLCLCLGRLENECARLILCTTLHATAQQLARHLKVFHSRSTLRPETAGDTTKPIGAAGLNVSAVTGQKRRVSTAKQPPVVNAVKQQAVSAVVAQANRKSDEEELMATLFGDSINLTNVNFSVCCVGPTAKLLLTDCIERGNAKASWIYIDALTYSQVISAAKEFGEASSGYLIKCLKEAMQVEDQSPRAYSPPAPQTDRKESLPTTAGTTTTDDSMRRLSVAYKTPKYIIFYGFQQFIQHFPQICSLFYSMSSNVVPEMPPGAYISMSDGSNFYAAKNIRFVLCLPSSNETITSWLNRYEIKTINVSEAIKQPARYYWDNFKVKLEYIVRRGEYFEVVESTMEHLVFPVLDDLKYSDFIDIENMFICLEKDIENAMAFVTIANYGEVLRAATTQCCVNFMITYTTSDVGLLDSKIEEYANSWDRSTSELGKLPFPVSQHKLASLEHIVWEKWIDDAKVKSSMKKEYSLSELFVSTTKIERIIGYVVRQFNASDKHFILCGQNYIGKSAIVRRIIKQLEQLLTDYKFIWMDCTGRFDLIEMQNKLSAISLTNKKACLIIDHFCFCESSKALLELYTDHTMLVTHNEPQLCVTDLRLMLVMENGELDKCWAYGEFRKNFHVIPIKPLSETELNYILERLICWHLNTKTFSSEYLSMVPLLAGASQQIFKIFGKPIDQLIPYIIRLAKGLMFAFPDNTPDLDCMKRLWIHEIIRILYDRELKNEIVQQFLEKLDPILEEFLKTTVEKLFPSRSEKGENDDDDFYDKKDAPSWALPDFKLEKLLYSEMAGAESSMDGINYGIVRRNDFNRAIANLHFEYTNNHSGFEVRLVVTDFSSDHCQRLMRALRQHNEHIVLAGHPGCGRHQCVKLATFGVVGLVYHTFFDTQTAEAFENSWRNVMIRVINVLASANQPVSVVFHLDYCIDKIPIEWLTMLKQWLQRPVIGDFLSDTVIIKMAEKMIESEKTLATLVQSSNIRLPGQRYCQFLSFEAYKNVDLLRNTLEARLADFLHAVFLIPSSHLHLFEWCTADYYKSITNGECKTMLDKITIDCVAPNKHRISDAIDQLFSATKDLIARAEFNCLQFYADSKLLYDLAESTVVLFNKKHGQLEQRTTLLTTALDTSVRVKELSIVGAHSSLFELNRKLEDADLVMMFLKRTQQEAATESTTLKEKIERLQKDCTVISDKLLQRNARIGIVLEAPIKDFRETSEKLTVYTAADYAKLAKLKTPSLGLKYTIEAVRRVVERGFKPSRNHLEAWLNSIKTLSNKDFCEKVAKFDPNSINSTKLKALTEILKNQDIKEQRLIIESPLAADLCKWVKSAQNFANSNKQLKSHRSAASDLSKQLSSKQDQLNTLKDKYQFLARRLISVEKEIEQQDRTVHKLNRLIFYRQRGDIVLQALSPLQNRWKTMIVNAKVRLDNLLGNSIIQSAFRVLFGCVNADAKTAILSKIRSSLIRYNIQYEEKFTAVPTLAIEYFRWISWKEPWPLIQTKRSDLANTLKFFYNDCALLDMSQMAESWADREVLDKLLRSSYSDTALIITNVQSSPPAAFYEILLREPDKEKRTVEFMERSILMGENFKLVFLTTHELSSFEPEFLRMVTPIKLEEQFDMKDSQLGGESLFQTEEDLLKQLTNYSAIDILETEDVTNQIIQLAESIPLS